MAVYIQIRKVSETDFEAVYDYFPEGEEARSGRLSINKASGKTSELQKSKGDGKGFYYQRAARKVSENRERGEYPEVTSWAS